MSERIRIEYEPLDDLLKLRDPENPKHHAPAAIDESFLEHGFVSPILVDDASNVLGAGHGRLGQLEERRRAGQEPPARIEVDGDGRWLVPVIRGVRFKSAKARRKYALADNRLVELGGWDNGLLKEWLVGFDGDLLGSGFGEADLASFVALGAATAAGGAGSLAEKFLVPPFSVLDARQGYWQERKRAWLALGIKSEIGRGGGKPRRQPEARDEARAER